MRFLFKESFEFLTENQHSFLLKNNYQKYLGKKNKVIIAFAVVIILFFVVPFISSKIFLSIPAISEHLQ